MDWSKLQEHGLKIFDEFSNLQISSQTSMMHLLLHWSPCGITVLLLYVDDIIISGSDPECIVLLHNVLQSSFHMKDLGSLTYFVGLEIQWLKGGLFSNLHKYTNDLILQAQLQNLTPVDVPFELNLKYRKNDGTPLEDPIVSHG